jgi:putative restriction endonuclease
MIGEIEVIKPGQMFLNRQALHNAVVHRGLMNGISAGGGESIVLSGGYKDDHDGGDIIIYTGEGGRDPASGHQIADQQMTKGNLALSKHYQEGNPIRVCRGYKLDSPYAPKSGYRYDGLYRIDSCWNEHGIDGFLIWRYRLVKIPTSEQIVTKSPLPAPEGTEQPTRSTVYTSRVIRNSEVGNYIKTLYDHTCQISGVRLAAHTGPYAEACHIQPVGAPHNGPDTVDNVICLSPNMHVLFDLGAISLTDDLKLLGIDKEIKIHADHRLSLDGIRYHRKHIYKKK